MTDRPVPAGELAVSIASDEREWNRFVAGQPGATGYHLWNWRHVFERAFDHEAVYLAAHRGGEIAGVLPLVIFRSWLFGRFAVSLPFVNYGGVLASDDEIARALVRRAQELGRHERLQYIELRHQRQEFADLPAKQHKVSMTLHLGRSVEEMWTGLDRKVRNQVRKAEKSGLTAERGGSELLPAFYRVFAHNMRDLGTPVYSRRFFEEVFRQFPAECQVFVVKHDKTTVAAAITYRHRESVEVPWASSLLAYRSMSPNNLLYWEMIKWAIETGLPVFDFGRSTPDEGTFHFKQQWGAEPAPLWWEYVLTGRDTVPDHSPKNPKFQRAIAAWKRLPVGVTSALGPMIVRSIP